MVESISIYVVVLGVGVLRRFGVCAIMLNIHLFQIFFFWNRILGGIVGFVLRKYLWKTADGHISIGKCCLSDRGTAIDGVCKGSLQLSPLAGRILFKDVRYHSTNMSARVLLGHITWRYWKWRIRKEDSDGQYRPCIPRIPS
jgi:hypothetical protein